MEVWRFIAVYKHLHDGQSPTLREIGEAVFSAADRPTFSNWLLRCRTDIRYARGIRLKRLPAEFYCPCCGERMRVIRQPAISRGNDVLLADCQNADCDLYQATLTLGSHHQLSSEQIAGYGRALRKVVTR